MRAAFVGSLRMGRTHFTKAPYRAQNGQQKAPFLSHHTRERAQSNFIQLRRNSNQQFSAKYLMVRTI